MREKFGDLKRFHWRLFAALCALAFVPAIYQTVKTFLISSSGQDPAFDVIGQMEWFDLIDETLRAFLIIPLYSVLNKILSGDGKNFARYTFKTGLITLFIYTLFSVGVLFYGIVLIKAMNPNEIDITAVDRYLKLETIAFMAGITVHFINVVFVVVGKEKNVYIFLAVKTVMSLIVDFALIPNMGIYGAAVSNIIVNAILAAASYIVLHVQKYIEPCWLRKSDLSVFKGWCRTGVFSGGQQFIDNLIYALVVCKMVNMVAEQGNYWIANNFIWGWLLIPISALSQVIRHDCKDGYHKLKHWNYYFIAAAAVAVWAITIPLWTPFYRYAEHLGNADEIFLITIKLVPFYVAYAGSAVMDNIFIGLGKTTYNAINSLVVNLIYYGIFYILYRTGIITFSMDVIILMFGFGMVVHLIVAVIEERLFLCKFEKKEWLSSEDCKSVLC